MDKEIVRSEIEFIAKREDFIVAMVEIQRRSIERLAEYVRTGVYPKLDD